MTRVAYVRKTDTIRREPGGLARAVLMLVNDGFATSMAMARILDTSIDNVNGALGRLYSSAMVNRSADIPVQWSMTLTGTRRLADDENWT